MFRAGKARLSGWTVCLCFGLIWLSGAGQAQSPLPAAPSLSGSVVDATGLPLAGVTIALRGTSNPVAHTNIEGRFTFPNLREGEYELTATLSGFATIRQSVRIVREQAQVVSLTLAIQLRTETIVTASRAGQADVLDTPMAVSVLTGRELTRMQDRTVENLAGRVPGLTFSQNTGLAQVTIRGIGTNAVFAGSDPSSAVYLDGVYLARPAMVLADFLDLERVEVLRGPQGTLYGRNSLGGAVNLITKAPTNDRDVSIRVAGGDRGTFRVAARMSGPIVSGRLMGSIALQRNISSGYVTDLDHPDHPLGGDDLTGARGQLRAVFSARSELQLSADVTHSDAPPLYYAKVLAIKPGFQIDNPTGSHNVRASFQAEGRIVQAGASARFTLDITPSLRLTSLSAFRQVDFDAQVDGDISELDLNVTHVHDIQHQISEELTVVQQSGKLTWIGGLFFFDEADHQPTSIFARAPRLENRLDPHVNASAAAAFGQATFHVTSGVAAIAGLRYTHERKTIDNTGGLYPIDTPIAPVPGSSFSYTDAIAHDAWSPKFAVEIRPREHLLAYASATRGFKSGGFNLTSPEAGRGYAPELAWSYEGGVKTDIGGGRTRLSVAAFHTDYTDLQVQTAIRPGVLDISNAASADIQGVEAEVATMFGATVEVGGYLAWLNATYDRYLATGAGGITSDAAGRRLNNAPEWSGRVWIDWTRRVGRSSSLSLRADSTAKTTVYFTPFNDTVQRQRSMGLLDVSAEFGPATRRWSIAAFARNLTNEGYITGSVSTPPPAIGGRPGDGRRVGVQFGISR